MRKPSTVAKERRKALAKQGAYRKSAPEDLTSQEKISELRDVIKRCKEDLKKFPDNLSILRKIKYYEDEITKYDTIQ